MTDQHIIIQLSESVNIHPPNLLGNTANIEPVVQNLNILPLTAISSIPKVDPMFNVIKDIAFNLILNIPGLRSKLDSILIQPNMAIEEIGKVYIEIQSKIPETEMNKLRRYISQDTSRTTLTSILQTSFGEIMEDGKIDMNDANHFLNLIYNIITLFNETSQNSNITISGEAVMFFLYFIVKCVLILCLDGEEETTAVGLLDTSFKLVSIAVMPLTKMKCSCNPFSSCKK
jgi:hypothetical protein